MAHCFNADSAWNVDRFTSTTYAMTSIGSRVDETGTLIRDGGDFALRRDNGGRWKLDMHRVLVDHVEKRVRISGVIVGERLVDVDALGPDMAAAG